MNLILHWYPNSVWQKFRELSSPLNRTFASITMCIVTNRIFSVFAPPPSSLVGTYYLHTPDIRAIFLDDEVLCNGTCSVTGGGGGITEKIQQTNEGDNTIMVYSLLIGGNKRIEDLFCLRLPVTEHVPYNKSLCKNMVRASGVAKNMHPLQIGWGGGAQTEKITK